MVEREFLTVPEAGALVLGVKSARSYEAAHQGLLPVVRLGKRMLVPRRALEALTDDAIARMRERLELVGA